jgi:hypothetical protein
VAGALSPKSSVVALSMACWDGCGFGCTDFATRREEYFHLLVRRSSRGCVNVADRNGASFRFLAACAVRDDWGMTVRMGCIEKEAAENGTSSRLAPTLCRRLLSRKWIILDGMGMAVEMDRT